MGSIGTATFFKSVIGSMILGCMIASAAESIVVEDVVIAENMALLSDPQRSKRAAAAELILKWAQKNPDKAIPLLLRNLTDATEPEARERCLQLLRPLSILDYNTMGEGYLGIQMGNEIAVKILGQKNLCYGLVITGVTPDSPAEKAGILTGDIIVSFNGEFWHQIGKAGAPEFQLSAKIRQVGAGKKVVFGVFNNGILTQQEATLARRPANLEIGMENRLLLNGQIPMNLGAMAQQQIEEEKNSDEFFQEWLSQQWKKYPAK